MEPRWVSKRYDFMVEHGVPIGPFAEQAGSLLARETCKMTATSDHLHEELKTMEDCEYEDKRAEHQHVETVELEFNPSKYSSAELNDFVVSGHWMKKLSVANIGRAKHFDPLLQKHVNQRKTDKKGGKRARKLKAKHACISLVGFYNP